MTELMKPPRARVTWTPEERAEWLAMFEMSGQTAAEFCRDNDLSPATLSWWLRKPQAAEATEGEFVEVPVPTPRAASNTAVTMHLSSGARLEIATGTDVAWLAQLLRAVG